MEKREMYGDIGVINRLTGWLVGTTDYMDAISGKCGKYFSAYKHTREEAEAYAKQTNNRIIERWVSFTDY